MLSNSFKDLKKPFKAFSEVAPPLPISAKRFFWLTPIVSNNVVIALESLDRLKNKVLICVPIVEAFTPATEKAVAKAETEFTVTPKESAVDKA